MVAFRQGSAFDFPAGNCPIVDSVASSLPVPDRRFGLICCGRHHAGNRGREDGRLLTAVQSAEPAVRPSHPASDRPFRSLNPFDEHLRVQAANPTMTPCMLQQASERCSAPGWTVRPGTLRKPAIPWSALPVHCFAPLPEART